MWERVQTYFVVTLVTVLIWIWADTENNKTEATGVNGLPVATTELAVSAVPIYLATPPGVLPAGFRLIVESPEPVDGRAVAAVRVVTPVAAAASIRDGTADLRLVVYLSAEDLQAGVIAKSAELEAGPADVRLVNAPPTVRVRVVR